MDGDQTMTWHKITKFYKGGMSEFQIAVPKGIRLTKSEWDEILEWVGDNTTGGHNYGYRIKTRRLGDKSKSLSAVSYPSGLCAKLMDFGKEVISKRKMIGA